MLLRSANAIAELSADDLSTIVGGKTSGKPLSANLKRGDYTVENKEKGNTWTKRVRVP
jgi:hypothetical protein